MAQVCFTQQLARFTALPTVQTGAGTLRAALEAAFEVNPALRGYILDEQGALRVNLAVFIDGVRCAERVRLLDPLQADSKVHVLQALSGG